MLLSTDTLKNISVTAFFFNLMLCPIILLSKNCYLPGCSSIFKTNSPLVSVRGCFPPAVFLETLRVPTRSSNSDATTVSSPTRNKIGAAQAHLCQAAHCGRASILFKLRDGKNRMSKFDQILRAYVTFVKSHAGSEEPKATQAYHLQRKPHQTYSIQNHALPRAHRTPLASLTLRALPPQPCYDPGLDDTQRHLNMF